MDLDDRDDEQPDFTTTNADDHAILMHREVHFSGNFDLMIDYYEREGKGVNPQFELSRIRQLAAYEKTAGQNLAAMMLAGAEMEQVHKAKHRYKSLRDLYEVENPKNRLPQLIADLILSEEDDPEAEIEAIVAEKGAIVPHLLALLRSEDFADSLFPGYGSAPALAARCLGLIGDKRAIISLFEAIGESDFFNEDCLLDALRQIGMPAKEFLLKVLHGRPLNFDNERAAIALVAFRDDPAVSAACLELLLSGDTWSDTPLTIHLILACEGLTLAAQRQQFKELLGNPHFPKLLRRDIQTVASSWQE
jgi:hypothetical protein